MAGDCLILPVVGSRGKPLPVLWCLERLLEPVPNAGDTALCHGDAAVLAQLGLSACVRTSSVPEQGCFRA